jgi:PAS domain-containing protein
MQIAEPPVMERQLRVALDNMPGALVYTDDDLNILFCNDRFREMYPVPSELLQPGRPIPDFCATSPSTGTTAKATSMHR